jgi:uncharacterized surface protein with fasciclin (FAS1) repeats
MSESEPAASDIAQVETLLGEKFSTFSKLFVAKAAWKEMADATNGFTILAPSNAAFAELGESTIKALGDVRNEETTEKITLYHFISDPVTKEQLLESSAVNTVGGKLTIGQSTSGGFFGFGGQQDGGVKINGAEIVASYEVGNSLVHEMDKLVNPQLLWGFMDQLRIPGSS